MAKNYKHLAQEILEKIGGKDNVEKVYHCMTRLRFTIVDDSKVNLEVLSKINGTVGALNKGGQFQVIIGNNVADVYKSIAEELQIIDSASQNTNINLKNRSKHKKISIGAFFDVIASLFGPIILVIAGAGIFQGLLAIFTTQGVIVGESAKVLGMIGDAAITMLPILLAVTAAKKFNANPYIAISIAGLLVSPTMILEASKYTIGESGYLHLFGIPLSLISYKGAMIPTIIAVYIQSKFEILLNKWIPKVVRALFVPLIILVVMGPLMLMAFGPIGNYVGIGLAWVIEKIFSWQPWLTGAIYGGLRPILVMFGMHYALMPISIQNLNDFGYDYLSPITLMSTAAQGGAVLGCYLFLKNKEQKQVGAAASISGIIGITEPALYGFLIKYKQVLIITLTTGSIFGAIVAGIGLQVNAFAMPSWLTIAIYYNGSNPTWSLLMIIFLSLGSYIAACAIVFIVGFDEKLEQHKKEYEGIKWYHWNQKFKVYKKVMKENKLFFKNLKDRRARAIITYAISKGKYINLEDLENYNIGHYIGKTTYAVKPIKNFLVAPIDGIIEKIFENENSLIVANKELDVKALVHFGVEKEPINKENFKLLVKEGDLVKAKQILISFEIKELKNKKIQYTSFAMIDVNKEKYDIEQQNNNEVTNLNKKPIIAIPKI